MLHGLFKGAQYNSEAGAKCAVYSRARTKQGRGVIKEIRYLTYTCTENHEVYSHSSGSNMFMVEIISADQPKL